MIHYYNLAFLNLIIQKYDVDVDDLYIRLDDLNFDDS